MTNAMKILTPAVLLGAALLAGTAHAQAPYAQAPYAQAPYAQAPYAQAPYGRDGRPDFRGARPSFGGRPNYQGRPDFRGAQPIFRGARPFFGGAPAQGGVRWEGDVDDTTIVYVHREDVRTQTAAGKSASNVNVRRSGFLPDRPATVFLRRADGRGRVRIVQQPSPDNDWTAAVRLRDPQPGRGHYEFELAWQGADGGPDQGRRQGNQDGDDRNGDDRAGNGRGY